jgi:hypothetical protein
MSNSAYNEGYKRGLEGKDSSSWGQAFNDVTFGSSGDSQSRKEGHKDGTRDAAFIKAQKKANEKGK